MSLVILPSIGSCWLEAWVSGRGYRKVFNMVFQPLSSLKFFVLVFSSLSCRFDSANNGVGVGLVDIYDIFYEKRCYYQLMNAWLSILTQCWPWYWVSMTHVGNEPSSGWNVLNANLVNKET